MTSAILAALLAVPVHVTDRDEPADSRAARLALIAQAIDAVARDDYERSFLVAQARHESGLARYVQEGRCLDGPRGAQCDPDRDGKPRAVGPWQVWAAHCRGSDTLDGQVRCVLKLARYGRQRCTNGWLGAFAAQRGMYSCQWSQSAARVRSMRIALERIRRARWEASRGAS